MSGPLFCLLLAARRIGADVWRRPVLHRAVRMRRTAGRLLSTRIRRPAKWPTIGLGAAKPWHVRAWMCEHGGGILQHGSPLPPLTKLN